MQACTHVSSHLMHCVPPVQSVCTYSLSCNCVSVCVRTTLLPHLHRPCLLPMINETANAGNVIAAKFHAQCPCWPANNLICLQFYKWLSSVSVTHAPFALPCCYWARSALSVCVCVPPGFQRTPRQQPWTRLKLGSEIWRNSCLKETDLNASSAWWVWWQIKPTEQKCRKEREQQLQNCWNPCRDLCLGL